MLAKITASTYATSAINEEAVDLRNSEGSECVCTKPFFFNALMSLKCHYLLACYKLKRLFFNLNTWFLWVEEKSGGSCI